MSRGITLAVLSDKSLGGARVTVRLSYFWLGSSAIL